MAKMVFGKIAEIRADLGTLLLPATWDGVVAEAQETDCTLTESELRTIIQAHCLSVVSDFDHRIMERINHYPYSLLLFARDCPTTRSKCRYDLACEILDTPDAKLHRTARKLKQVFVGELVLIKASGGQCSMLVYAPIRLVVRTWRADSSEVESVMNMIQNVIASAPRASMPLVDARVGNRKALREIAPAGLNRTKWSNISESCEAMVTEATTYLDAGRAIMEDSERFTPPKPWPCQLTPAVSVPKALHASDEFGWAWTLGSTWKREAIDLGNAYLSLTYAALVKRE